MTMPKHDYYPMVTAAKPLAQEKHMYKLKSQASIFTLFICIDSNHIQSKKKAPKIRSLFHKDKNL